MSCSKGENCVCDKLREIASVQDSLLDDCCDVSCDRSIRDLLGTSPVSDFNTVPFILFCKGDCKPFEGFGVKRERSGGNTFLNCFQGFVFRVKSVDDDCCAVIELLETSTAAPSASEGSKCNSSDPCDEFPGNSIRSLEATGVCLTVDLNCFCGISCLPAVNID
ncbi:CotY/CotZ family spore coat protein [Bacillus marinisedimentorum]|uniref:CotY/CotZ family spore coat protein n=1 Tax=Bacillus marinisedimentorum TaxID=1821260 RepID=UPI0007E0D3C9|nr:CotY/CotZ family spore coat protein [Bacillus marinisedimentorum]